MRVVVTRPQASGEKTAALLRERGHEPVLIPLTEPVHRADVAIQALAKPLQALAVTSAEAIRVLAGRGLAAPEILHLPLFAVGTASAEAARKAGFHNVTAGDSDGPALAQLIADEIKDNTGARSNLLYLAGTPRDAGFEKRLSELTVPFETVEVYEMQPLSWNPAQWEGLADKQIDVVLLYSSEAARLFFKLLTSRPVFKQWDHCKFICISKKVLSDIPPAFQHNAFASTAPSEAEMFDLLDLLAGT
ncbi:uroporphyrinogen-III synthase [Agrobacterium rosae]|uniref:Uroporphyrinogen-III synthase n=1 Tax=Agrobacterium rosae TaxID=1972867 RepID=A0A1R3U3I2_9HYPH|nr:uroporphyrinogen-III synthase [Agrobacterium rosae]SCX29393.1 uroporphyrinogen-III synthase [Agrobacterium rosae]